MEYGLIPTINQYADNNELLLQQVQPSSEIAKLSSGDEAKKIAKDNFMKGIEATDDKTSETKDASKVTASAAAKYQEVVLTNLNFGFNNSSGDFYVKAIRGDKENQYPTDEMMRLKAYYIAEAKAQRAAQLNS